MKGKVKFFDETKNFGFISGDDGKEYFVHRSALKGLETLHEEDTVKFDVEEGDRGLKAVNVATDEGGEAEEAPAEEAPAEEESNEEEAPAEEDKSESSE